MSARVAARPPRTRWFWPVALVGGAALLLFLGLFALDYSLQRPQKSLLRLIFTYDPETAQNALGNLAQVVVAVLGLVVTVVSIVVQLAANRYTPRITDLFFRDRTNLLVLGFFVTTSIAAVWVSLSVERDFVPERAITGTLLLVTLSLLLVIPYFGYVFDFLDPEAVIARIRDAALRHAADGSEEPAHIEARQRALLLRVTQLGDIAVNAVGNRDKIIATFAVDALKDLGVGYLARKAQNPALWFHVGEALGGDPDFVSMDPSSVADISGRRTWLEWKLLRQLQGIYSASLADQPELSSLCAIDTRYLGEAALATDEGQVLRLVVKFLNTDLRAALNGQRVRAAYNLLNQYRLLTERLLASGDASHRLTEDIAGYLRYYAQVAQQQQLGFVAETVAYDLAALCEVAHLRRSRAHDALLRCLLSVDQSAETEAQEKTLRGVRKAQAKLATLYLARGDEVHARQIYEDMKDEHPERLRSIREELEKIDAQDFWEIIDRGTNFDYLDDGRKAQLPRFFAWFSAGPEQKV